MYNREPNLFECIKVPEDDVRLASVNCLLAISAEEWKTEDVGKLVSMIESYKNLGAGKTEEVLSCLYMILSKICKKPNTPTARDFISKSAENAITNCFDMYYFIIGLLYFSSLSRNMERNVRDNPNENEEKISLSMACIYFLKTTSTISNLRPFFRGWHIMNAMQRSLTSEEAFLDESFIPIEIERTWAGKNLEYLLQFTSGSDTIDAYHLVSYRIIAQIADVLQGKPEDKISDINLIEFKPEELKKQMEKNFKDRIKKEFKIWDANVKSLIKY